MSGQAEGFTMKVYTNIENTSRRTDIHRAVVKPRVRQRLQCVWASPSLFLCLQMRGQALVKRGYTHSRPRQACSSHHQICFQKPFPMPALKMISNQTPYLFQSPAADSLTIGFSPARNILLYKTAEVSHSSSLLVPATEWNEVSHFIRRPLIIGPG